MPCRQVANQETDFVETKYVLGHSVKRQLCRQIETGPIQFDGSLSVVSRCLRSEPAGPVTAVFQTKIHIAHPTAFGRELPFAGLRLMVRFRGFPDS